MLANSVDTRLGYVPEQSYGITPDNPIFQTLRITSESLTGGVTTVQSTELRPDRNISDAPVVSASASGDIGIEMSNDTFDELLAAVLFNPWQGNQLTNGLSSAMRSFTLEKRFTRGPGDYSYFRYAGMVPSAFNLDISADAILTGSFSFMGKGEAVSTAEIAGATYKPATTTPVINASNNFAQMSIMGDDTAFIQSCSLTLDNSLRGIRAVGYRENIDMGVGMFTCSGTINAYFKSNAMYEAFINSSAVSLSMTFGDEPGRYFKITIPKLKFTAGEIVAGGQDEDIIAAMQFTAIFSDQINGTIRIERNIGIPPATVPATGVILDVTEANLSVGYTETIVATVQPDDATDKTVTWVSSDPDVATVVNGVITAVAAGTATITATPSAGTAATCGVTVG